MSQWTHVAGVIRFDGIVSLGMPAPDLGKTVSYDDPEHKWSDCNVPKGSEGSLEHSLHTSSSESSLARWVATIWGDLRSYDDADEIIAYFKRITEGRMVRGGNFTINVDGKPARTFAYDVEKSLWYELSKSTELEFAINWIHELKEGKISRDSIRTHIEETLASIEKGIKQAQAGELVKFDL
jgi:hypothetical protein